MSWPSTDDDLAIDTFASRLAFGAELLLEAMPELSDPKQPKKVRDAVAAMRRALDDVPNDLCHDWSGE
jgi:hypothetical protein